MNPGKHSFLMTSCIAALLVGGCSSSSKNPAAQNTPAASTSRPTAVMAASAPAPGAGQSEFDTPDAAVAAVVDAAQKQDHDAMHKIFGPSAAQLSTGDPVADNNDFKRFAAHAAGGTRVEQLDDNTAQVYIGPQDWPFPIPLVRAADGKWFFNTPAGISTILARKIGHNELETIGVCQAYVEAQREYAGVDRDGDGVLQYAQRLFSKPGTHDGLYWPATAGEPQSPFGPLAAQAADEGYEPIKGAARRPYHGYYFRVLKAQGPAGPGGAYSYVINGRMIAGYALVAWPEKYGTSGVMTFIVNHYGQVYQKDLGPDTTKIADKIREYNPDSTWTKVSP